MSKLYSFTNNWLSDHQKGLQTAHLVNELSKKYLIYGPRETDEECELYSSWATIGETIIMLKGGSQDRLDDLKTLLGNQEHYPWAFFREDKASLNCALTAVGIILPERFNTREDRDYIIQLAGDVRVGRTPGIEQLDAQLAELLIKSVPV